MKFHHRRHAAERNIFSRTLSDIHARADCEPADPSDTLTDRLNLLLNSSGPGYILPLCPSTQYFIQAPILFNAPNQEISTVGYPTGDERATLVVAGPVANGQGHTTAVDGTCSNCSGVTLRNIQINGTRLGASPTGGGANIEMGGGNSNQLIEYVHSFDPRSWSCLHIAEGPFTCNNVTVQHNDIGPCGSDTFQEWADGISVSCRNSYVFNNTVNNPTDGGIVLFGSPGTVVVNNTVYVETQTLLGGINMVDYDPWQGDYTNTVVRDNIILGGFSTEQPNTGEQKGTNNEDVIIKIGIAIGPRTWFGDRYGNNVSQSGTVLNNRLSGAFGYGIAMTSARNFTVENNVLFGNTSFIGARGPNCSTTDATPNPGPFVVDYNTTQQSTVQVDFQNITDGDGLTCILPPDGGDYWPFGGNPSNPTSSGTPTLGQGATSSNGLSGGAKAGIAIGVILGVVAVAILTYFLRKRAIDRATAAKVKPWTSTGYARHKEDVGSYPP
ncbi:Right handed beta helix domain-containing protein [Abortiporus biennis]